jgi:hypothetical protein
LMQILSACSYCRQLFSVNGGSYIIIEGDSVICK